MRDLNGGQLSPSVTPGSSISTLAAMHTAAGHFALTSSQGSGLARSHAEGLLHDGREARTWELN
jgi:hypothetical protein